jgi:hypothetical protein
MEEIKKEWKKIVKHWRELPKSLKIPSYLVAALLLLSFLPSPIREATLTPLLVVSSIVVAYLSIYLLIMTIKTFVKTIKAILWETRETIRFLKSLKIANFSFKNNSLSFTLFYRPRRQEKPSEK